MSRTRRALIGSIGAVIVGAGTTQARPDQTEEQLDDRFGDGNHPGNGKGKGKAEGPETATEYSVRVLSRSYPGTFSGAHVTFTPPKGPAKTRITDTSGLVSAWFRADTVEFVAEDPNGDYEETTVSGTLTADNPIATVALGEEVDYKAPEGE